MVAVSALLPLQCCLDLALRHTTRWAVWDLGGSLSLSVVLKVFGMLFMTRSHVQGLEVSLGDAECYRVLSLSLCAFSLVLSGYLGLWFWSSDQKTGALVAPLCHTLPLTMSLSRAKEQEYWHREKQKSNGFLSQPLGTTASPNRKGGSLPQF